MRTGIEDRRMRDGRVAPSALGWRAARYHFRYWSIFAADMDRSSSCQGTTRTCSCEARAAVPGPFS